MSRRDIDPAVFEAWAKGEADNRHRRQRQLDHGDGERGFNALGFVLLIVIGFVLINVPTLFQLIAPLFLKG